MTGVRLVMIVLVGVGVAIAAEGYLHLRDGANAGVYVPVLLAGLVIVAFSCWRLARENRNRI